MTQNRGVPFQSDWNYAHLLRLLTLFEWDCTENLWWRHDEKNKLCFFVRCNDVFNWGSADCEEIIASDLPALEQAYDDVIKVDHDYGDIYFSDLWVSRQINRRPQGAYMKSLPESLRPLFEACGPVREVDLVNPVEYDETKKARQNIE